MNQNMSVQVVLGALLHDIGKFFERAELLGEYRKDPEKEQAYCPRRPEGYYSHKHVLHTVRFCELLEERVPALSPPQGSDQNWIAFAARHHVGSSALERLVAAADHFASAEREKGLYYERRIHQKTRLESLLERVNGHEPVEHRLPLRVVSMDKEALYPRRLDTFKPAMTEHTFHEGPFDRVAISPDHLPLVAEYKVMATGMLEDLERLPSPPQHGVDGVYSVIRGMLALLEKYLVTVPAATNVCHPDISLYDHLRVTAAIGEGLYHWHESRGDLETANFEEQNTAKWRLVCGDFSGIQRFIYSITSKGAAKGLRGRSFFVQLLCDAVSERLLHRLGLSACCRIYSSGGKFFLLIPANLEETLRTEADAINRFLFKQFGGDVFLGIGVAQVHGEDFRGGNMGPR
jgi:CRISPR-associated protein Csm1